jgi:hypothetical protein
MFLCCRLKSVAVALMARRGCGITGVLSFLCGTLNNTATASQNTVISVRCYIKIRVTILWDVAQCSLLYILHVLEESSAPIIRVGPSPELGMDVVPRLRMHGAMPPPAPCTFLMCTGTSSPVYLSHSFSKNRWRFFFFFFTVFYQITKLPPIFHFHFCVSL